MGVLQEPGLSAGEEPEDHKRKRNGTELCHTSEGQWDSIVTQMVGRFKETGHPVFKSISAVSRGILKGNITATPYTSLRMLRTQSSEIKRFTQQISSVTTEQLLAGVKILV